MTLETAIEIVRLCLEDNQNINVREALKVLISFANKSGEYRWHYEYPDAIKPLRHDRETVGKNLKECQLINGDILSAYYCENNLGRKVWHSFANGEKHRQLTKKVVRWREIEEFEVEE